MVKRELRSKAPVVPAGSWLVRDGRVLCSLETPQRRRGKARGLLGRDGVDGAMLIAPARSVHSMGMRFDLDVAIIDKDWVVVKIVKLKRWRLTMPVWRSRAVLEAEAGAFQRWDLKLGDVLEIRE